MYEGKWCVQHIPIMADCVWNENCNVFLCVWYVVYGVKGEGREVRSKKNVRHLIGLFNVLLTEISIPIKQWGSP